MTVTTLIPASTGTYQELALGAGADELVAVQTNDGDTTYIQRTSGPGERQTYNMDDVTAGHIVSALVNHVIVRKIGSDQRIRHRSRHNSTDENSVEDNITSTVYVNHSGDLFALLPGGGNYDTATKVNNAEFGVNSQSDANDWRLTQHYVVVTHVPPAGGYFYLLNQWIPPLLTAASHAVTFKEIAMFFRRFKCRPSNRDEYEQIQKNLLRRPVYGCLGG